MENVHLIMTLQMNDGGPPMNCIANVSTRYLNAESCYNMMNAFARSNHGFLYAKFHNISSDKVRSMRNSAA